MQRGNKSRDQAMELAKETWALLVIMTVSTNIFVNVHGFKINIKTWLWYSFPPDQPIFVQLAKVVQQIFSAVPRECSH